MWDVQHNLLVRARGQAARDLGLQSPVLARLPAALHQVRRVRRERQHPRVNTFRDAALTMGELCHFLGREFVCGIFTWPAGGKRGILFGYQVDYESRVFAAEHLRKTIRAIAETPGARTHSPECTQPGDGRNSSPRRPI